MSTAARDRPERLVRLDAALLAALADSDVDAAERLSGLAVPHSLVGERWLWQMRTEQLTHTPDDLEWIARLVVSGEEVVGHAGFHGGPNDDGVVELGYWVSPQRRGQGHGAAALRLLVDWGRDDPRVRTLRACVGLGNDRSTRLVLRAGFTHRGEVEDEQDGTEAVYELDVT
ncbi:GNAT family N-acetyltransferase [Solicola sp. PLA-1-18]|uniref:GNAT family N-acetyltransferase n=1 Tax=Solicola sp. PLA-1-18 TaxID=3380532 RepID=UPI003B827099